MSHINDIHHLALTTRDIKSQIEYFNDVLGCELVGLYWMHGVEGAWHGFLRFNDNCSLAFVEMPGIAEIDRTIGVTHAGSGGGVCAGGAMQHLSLNVDTMDELLAMRDRIRSRGITVYGPIDHGMCHSIYFAGLEDLALEVATSMAPIDGRAWIDPEVVELAGISSEELARYRNPVAYDGPPVSQPELDMTKPYLRGMPLEQYRALVSLPDEVVAEKFSFSEPPVVVSD